MWKLKVWKSEVRSIESKKSLQGFYKKTWWSDSAEAQVFDGQICPNVALSFNSVPGKTKLFVMITRVEKDLPVRPCLMFQIGIAFQKFVGTLKWLIGEQIEGLAWNGCN